MKLPNNPNIDVDYDPAKLKSICLAGGCFWGTEAFMERVRGVACTVVGYANSNVGNPSYEQVCTGTTGAAEAVHLQYDPQILPLPALLAQFFKTINPTLKDRQGGDVGKQYRTGIYYTSKADVPVIQSFLTEAQQRYGQPIVTEVLPLKNFYTAEDYHQKYLQKHPNGYCHVDLGKLGDQ